MQLQGGKIHLLVSMLSMIRGQIYSGLWRCIYMDQYTFLWGMRLDFRKNGLDMAHMGLSLMYQ